MFSQLVYGEARSIHHMVGDEPDRRQHVAFMCDRIEDRLVRIQRMRTTGFTEPANEDGIRRFQNPKLGFHSALCLYLFEDFREVLEIFALAYVHDDGGLYSLIFGFENQFIKLGK